MHYGIAKYDFFHCNFSVKWQRGRGDRFEEIIIRSTSIHRSNFVTHMHTSAHAKLLLFCEWICDNCEKFERNEHETLSPLLGGKWQRSEIAGFALVLSFVAQFCAYNIRRRRGEQNEIILNESIVAQITVNDSTTMAKNRTASRDSNVMWE